MRPIVILLGLALVAPLLPVAEGAHVGPCWHEYIEGYKDPVGTIKECNRRLFEWLPVDVTCRPFCEFLP